MQQVRFTHHVVVGDGTIYEEGQVVEMEEASAHRWIRRNKAVLVEGKIETAAIDPGEKKVKTVKAKKVK